jgi:hypothetical protein
MAYRVGLDNIDVTNDIVLDADGDNITFKAGSDDSTGLDFQQSNAGDWTFGPTTADKDLIIKVNKSSVVTEVMRLKGSNGFVGIGTVAPSALLHISGSDGTDSFRVDTQAATDNPAIFIEGTNSHVGLGTATPSDTLHIYGNAGSDGGIRFGNVSNNSKISADGTSTKFGSIGGHRIDLLTNNAARVTILPTTGYVGIGMTNPQTKLTVEGTITLKEQADADGDTAAYGQIWVNTATPNELYYTTDAGDDIQITSGTALAGAGSATTVTVTDNEATAEENLLTFVADAATATGTHGLEMDGNCTYNPSTGKITATGFIGALTGNADTATTATTATNVTVSANNSTDETVYPLFVDGATGGQGAETDTGLTYNPADGELTATLFTGALTGNVTGNASGTAATVTGGTQSSITTCANLTTTGALAAGSIATGFGAIDNGTSNITTGGILKVDVDSGVSPGTAATGVAAAGSITLGTGNDAGLYVASDNLYIENKTTDKDIVFRASDGGTYTTLMTIDGSESAVVMNETLTAGKIFSKTVTSVTADNATHTEITATTPFISVNCSGLSVTGNATDGFHDLGLVNGTVAGQTVTVSVGAGDFPSTILGVRIARGPEKASAFGLGVASLPTDGHTLIITDSAGVSNTITFNSAVQIGDSARDATTTNVAVVGISTSTATPTLEEVAQSIVVVQNSMLDANDNSVIAALGSGGAFYLVQTVGGVAGNTGQSGAIAGTALSAGSLADATGAGFIGGAAAPSGLDTSYSRFGYTLLDQTRTFSGGGSESATFVWDGTKWAHVSGGTALTL